IRAARGADRLARSEEDLKSQVEAFERQRIVEALEDSGGKVAPASRALGLTRAGLYKKLHKYGLRVDKR
ncbi:MAG: helix-turn-helix domain-containing protein, partial [Myxococcota bacterium]